MTRPHITRICFILLCLFVAAQLMAQGQDPRAGRRASHSSSVTEKTDRGPGKFAPTNDSQPIGDRPATVAGLISRWTGDGNADDLVGGNNGTLLNGAGYTSGVLGQAFQFDGVDDLMDAPSTGLPTAGGGRTMAMWVRIEAPVASESFFGGYGNFGEFTRAFALGASGANNSSFFSQWGSGLPGPDLQAGRWYHIAVTYTEGTSVLYIDGNPWRTGSLTVATSAGSRFFLGSISGTTGLIRRLKGAIDDARVYDRALTGSDILAVINERPTAACVVNGSDLRDGGFELNTDTGKNPAWSSFGTAFGNALCTLAECGDGLGSARPRDGNGWIWFDGTKNGAVAERASASQSLIIPAGGSASLLYYLRIGYVSAPANSTLVIYVDGNPIQTVNEPDVPDHQYNLRTADLSAYADGHLHLIRFEYNRPAGTTDSDNFTIDDSSVVNTCSTTPSTRDFDFDGDGKTDESVFRPSDNVWYLNRSQAGFVGYQFGAAGDLLAPADYTGDGKTDVAVFRPSSGSWFVLRSEDSTFYGYQFGANGDAASPGDFDGDGKADLAVFRGSSGTWYVQQSTAGFRAVAFGTDGDVPTLGDFDGDGKTDIAVFRPSNGVWYRLNSSNGSFFGAQFGQTGDKVLPADYSGDGKTDLAVWRPSDGTWYIMRSEDNSFYGQQFGVSSDLPAPGDYDGDGKADVAVFRPSSGVWYEQRSTSGFSALQFGLNGDKPTPNAFVY